MTRRHQILALLVIFVGICGLLPHLFWTLEAPPGQQLFKSAFDEDYYLWNALWSIPRPDRKISALIVQAFSAAVGYNNLPACLDIVWPMLITVAAWRLIERVAPEASLWSLTGGTLLVVSSDVLSLNCVVAWPPKWTWSSLGTALPQEVAPFLSWGSITFFEIFRSPDPQISYTLLLIWLERLWSYHREPSSRGLLVAGGLTAGVCSMLVFPACLSLIFLGLLTAFCRRPQLIFPMILGVATLYLQTSNFFGLQSAGWNQAFPSRLPTLSPSMFWSFFALIYLYRKSRWEDPADRWLACCALVPPVALNQQIITGVMISTRSWEWYGNYIFVAVALFGCLASSSARKAGLLKLVVVLGLIVLPVSQAANWRMWRKHNLRGALYAQLLSKYQQEIGRCWVVAEDFEITPQFVWRNGADYKFVLDYRKNLELDFHPNEPPKEQVDGRELQFFLEMALLRISPDELFSLLESELRSGEGHWWECLYHYRYCHPFFFDGRQDHRSALSGHILSLVQHYRRVLPTVDRSFGPVYVLSRTPLQLQKTAFPSLREIDRAAWQDQTIYLYRTL